MLVGEEPNSLANLVQILKTPHKTVDFNEIRNKLRFSDASSRSVMY